MSERHIAARTNVMNLVGGYVAWQQSGLTTTRDRAEPERVAATWAA